MYTRPEGQVPSDIHALHRAPVSSPSTFTDNKRQIGAGHLQENTRAKTGVGVETETLQIPKTTNLGSMHCDGSGRAGSGASSRHVPPLPCTPSAPGRADPGGREEGGRGWPHRGGTCWEERRELRHSLPRETHPTPDYSQLREPRHRGLPRRPLQQRPSPAPPFPGARRHTY